MLLRAYLLAVAVVSVLWTTVASATPFPGPDGFGYRGATIPFDFRDISTTGSPAFTGPTNDAVTGAVGIGFNFSFYGVTYSNVFIGSNGFVTFSPGQSNGCCNGGPLPGTTNPSNMVAAWFTDLGNNVAPASSIRYQTVGTPGSREFIVEYVNNLYCCFTASNTFEMILHEGTNDIELQYAHTDPNPHTRSVGIENVGGTVGMQFLFDNTSLLETEGLCFSSSGAPCSAAVVPEPTSLVLLGAGLFGLGLVRRRNSG